MSDRRAKVARLQDAGVEPWPTRFDIDADLEELRQRHDSIEAGAETGASYRIAGRLMGRRGHGKAVFCDLRDRTGSIQLLVTLDRLGDEPFAAFGDLDIGDWIGVRGQVIKSRRGELSIAVEEYQLLAKCIRPLPEKWHGLTDIEQRRGRRYLDLVVNQQSFDVFVIRSRIVSELRRFLEDRGYLEVETPVLQPLYGGAAARPFTTFHNELDSTFYLRIATELYLKRLIVGGMEKVFEVGKNFRNEGVSFKHNPEFTMVELYEAYANYTNYMDLLEELVCSIATTVLGGPVVQWNDTEISLAAPWRRVTLRDAIHERAGMDIYDSAADELRRRLEDDGVDTSSDRSWAQLVDHLLSHFVEPELVQPTFLTDYPVELSPFAKRRSDDPRVVERFECFVGGMEIANAFSELNDPEDQRARFEQQMVARAEGDDTAEQLDEDFIEALEYGMPPTAGLGIGVDRLTMLLTGQQSIRDVILFPARRAPR